MLVVEKIPSKSDAVADFISRTVEKIKAFPIDEDELFNVKLALEEALANAIRHGNKMNPELYAQVFLEIENEKLSIKVLDEGEGFDFKNLPDPTHRENVEKPFGRGVFLIKRLMDEVEFLNGGRGIKMVKFFNKPR